MNEELRQSEGTKTSYADVDAWRARYAREIVGESEALSLALEIASRAAEFDCPVLITGESGTGKELLAQAIHRASPRRGQPLIPVNCPAIPKELVESELFGHSRGAFTGATNARTGRFVAADGGSLFLDEIGEMDLNIQSKLLRVLQDYQVTPVGESRSQRVNVRIIAATNRDLDEQVDAGRFREDLLYRLNVVQIHLPALRERPQDVPVLLDHFIGAISRDRGLDAPVLGPAVRDVLCRYEWPGNIRQLHNVVERLVILSRGAEVLLHELPRKITGVVEARDCSSPLGEIELPAEGIDLRAALTRLEDLMIQKALSKSNGNKNQAAKLLGLKRTTLVEKLRKTAPASFAA